MEMFSVLLAFCAGTSPVTDEFPAQRPVTRSFDVFFDLCLKQQLSKQWRCQGFEMPSRSLWHHCNVFSKLLATDTSEFTQGREMWGVFSELCESVIHHASSLQLQSYIQYHVTIHLTML